MPIWCRRVDFAADVTGEDVGNWACRRIDFAADVTGEDVGNWAKASKV